MSIKISVLIPTYNRLPYLIEAVNSIFKQTYRNWEICISQDMTPNGLIPEIKNWCEQMCSAHPNFKFKTNQKNRGLAGNWNELVKMASGDYAILLGDDDRLLPEFMETMNNLIEANQADVVFSNQIFIDHQGHALHELTNESNRHYKRDVLGEGVISEPIKTVLENSVPMSASLTRLSFLKKYPFKEDLNTPEIEVFIRVALDGGVFAYSPKQLAEYRVHLQSATSSGLTIDHLLGYMMDIKIPTAYEINKKTFFADKIIPAINMSLRKGNKKLARKLLFSSYFPDKPFHKIIQKVSLFLPDSLIKKILR